MTKFVLLFSLFILQIPIANQVLSQENQRDSLSHLSTFSFHFTYQAPMGDMAKRFLNNANVGGSYDYITSKNWIYTAEFSLLFRDGVKETSILDNITSSAGLVIDGNGELADVFMWERGMHAGIKVGKLFSLNPETSRSGICVQAGVGFLQHKIQLFFRQNPIPQLSGDYIKGYDRLTNGIAFQQSITYRFYPKDRSVGFYVGLDAIEALTENRRAYDFNTMQHDGAKRLDILVGPRCGMSIILGKKKRTGYYMY